MLISCVKLAHALYSINYGINIDIFGVYTTTIISINLTAPMVWYQCMVLIFYCSWYNSSMPSYMVCSFKYQRLRQLSSVHVIK